MHVTFSVNQQRLHNDNVYLFYFLTVTLKWTLLTVFLIRFNQQMTQFLI